jgi:hypothetical protein
LVSAVKRDPELIACLVEANRRLKNFQTTTKRMGDHPLLTPILTENRLFVAEYFHGVKSDSTFGSELVFTCNAEERIGGMGPGQGAPIYSGRIKFYRKNDGPPTLNAEVLVVVNDYVDIRGGIFADIPGFRGVDFSLRRRPGKLPRSETNSGADPSP